MGQQQCSPEKAESGKQKEEVLLYRGADIDARANDGKTALMLGALVGQEDTVKLLLENGADVNGKTTKA